MNRNEVITVQAAKAFTMIEQAQTEYAKARGRVEFDCAAQTSIDALHEFAKAVMMFVNDYPYCETISDYIDTIIKDIEYAENIRKA
jgi:hypothetical protein